MQRQNRSARAPLVGTAFLLFLGLAVIPVSLRFTGEPVILSPRVAAAMDAWDQIAQVLGAGYHPGTEFESVVTASSDSEPAHSTDEADCARREFACARETEDPAEALPVLDANAGKVTRPRVICPKAASRTAQVTKRIEPSFADVAAPVSAEERVVKLERLGATKLEMLTRQSLLKNRERQLFWQGLEPSTAIKSLPIPMNLEVLVRLKPPAPSVSKATECKERAATDSRRPGRERARLTGSPSQTPNNCEL